MAEYFQCVDCGTRFDNEEPYLKHRAEAHPRAEREDALQGHARGPAEGVRDYAQQQANQQQARQPTASQPATSRPTADGPAGRGPAATAGALAMTGNEPLADKYECAEHQRSFRSRDEYLAHRASDHMHVPDDRDADTDEIRRERNVETDVDPLAGAESPLTQQSDEAEDPDQQVVSYGQVEDYPAEKEDSDPLRREVHRAPTPREG